MWLDEDIDAFESEYEEKHKKIFEREKAALESLGKMLEVLKGEVANA